MKKLFFLLILISFQTSYCQWEKTCWQSDKRIYKYWVQDSIVVINIIKEIDHAITPNDLEISIDSGKTFPLSTRFQNNIRVNDLLIDGKSIYVIDDLYLQKSDDFGANWQYIEPTNYSKPITLKKLVLIDSNIYLCTSAGLFVSFNKGVDWQNLKNGISSSDNIVNIAQFKNYIVLINKKNEVYFSNDKGFTWNNRSIGLENVINLEHIFGVGDTIFVSTGYMNQGGGIYFSTNDGQSWKKYKNDLFTMGSIKIVTIGKRLLLRYHESFYISSDNGNSWIQKNDNIPWQISKGISKWVVNNGRIYAGAGSELWVSKDTAESWSPVITGRNYAFVNSLAADSGAVYAAASSFTSVSSFPEAVFKSNDNGKNWIPTGIKNEDIHNLISSGNIIVSQGTENDFVSIDRGNLWTAYQKMSNLNHYTSPQNICILESNIFAVNNQQGILKSENHGVSWTPKSIGIPEKFEEINAIYQYNHKLYLLISNQLYTSDNNGDSWRINGSPIPGKGNTYYTRISIDEGMIIVQLDNDCFLSKDQGETWENITEILDLGPDYHIRALSIKSGLIFLAIQYYGALVSSDSGRTFKKINEGLKPDTYNFTNSFATLNGYLYIGLSHGDASAGIYRAKINDFLSATDESKDSKSFTISPNPAGDFITISNFKGSDRSFKILNLLGREVLSGEFTDDRISVASLPPGAYLIRIGNEAGMMLKK